MTPFIYQRVSTTPAVARWELACRTECYWTHEGTFLKADTPDSETAASVLRHEFDPGRTTRSASNEATEIRFRKMGCRILNFQDRRSLMPPPLSDHLPVGIDAGRFRLAGIVQLAVSMRNFHGVRLTLYAQGGKAIRHLRGGLPGLNQFSDWRNDNDIDTGFIGVEVGNGRL